VKDIITKLTKSYIISTQIKLNTEMSEREMAAYFGCIKRKRKTKIIGKIVKYFTVKKMRTGITTIYVTNFLKGANSKRNKLTPSSTAHSIPPRY
jgi:hypothetical protein